MDVYQRRRLLALSAVAAIFVILVLVIRSCGGDDEEAPITPVSGATQTTPTSLSSADFALQGDTICLETNTILAQTDESDASSGEAGEIVAGELEQLQTLPSPTDNEDQLQSYFAALQDQVAAYDERQTAAERGDDATVAEIDLALEEARTAAAKAARKFGFEICGDRSEVGESSGGENGAQTETGAETTADPGTVAPTETVTPAPTEPAPAAPTDTGGGATPVTPEPAPAPTEDGGSSGSGGIAP